MMEMGDDGKRDKFPLLKTQKYDIKTQTRWKPTFDFSSLSNIDALGGGGGGGGVTGSIDWEKQTSKQHSRWSHVTQVMVYLALDKNSQLHGVTLSEIISTVCH